MKRIFAAALCALALVSASFAASKSSDAIVRLLNSRASGSRSEFKEAAKIVAEDAKEGRPLQQFVIALVANDSDLPKKLRLTPEKRKEYLDQARDKIRRLAEEKNNALAWYLLSLEKNDMSFLKRAADGNNVQALNAWGTITLTNALRSPSMETNEVERVLVKCFGMFKKAADAGDANGLYNLGMCYMQGYGCVVDEDLAYKCFCSSAEAGHPESINNVGGFYRDGIVVRANPETAAKWFARSASLGNVYGMFNYALALQRGEGVEKDVAKAIDLFKESAALGNAEAMNAYGMCYYNGDGVAKDEAEAVKWYRASAARGFAPAMDNLSSCYSLGTGVRKDEKESLAWKVRGMAARGDRNAAAWLQQNGY